MTGRVAFPALGIAFLLIAGQAMRTRLSPDEWQHLTTVADIVRGTNEYVGSWDNHTHGFHTIVASFLGIECVKPREVMAVRIGLRFSYVEKSWKCARGASRSRTEAIAAPSFPADGNTSASRRRARRRPRNGDACSCASSVVA
jgi:hypothetical protein